MQKQLITLVLVALLAIPVGGCKAVAKLLSKGGDDAAEAAARHADDVTTAGRGVHGADEAAAAAHTAHAAEQEGSTAIDLTVEAASVTTDLATAEDGEGDKPAQ